MTPNKSSIGRITKFGANVRITKVLSLGLQKIRAGIGPNKSSIGRITEI